MTIEWRRWAFAVVPALGLFELGLHLRQTTVGVVPEADWLAARAIVEREAKPNDLVVFAPAWADPIGRLHFKDALATLEREARPDATRYPRAIEVSIRGKHTAELATWRNIATKQVGAIALTTFENPSPAVLADDLLLHVKPEKMKVALHGAPGESFVDCVWTNGSPQAGSLGSGPTVPGERFACGGGLSVGTTVLFAMDHTPRRCLLAPPPGGTGSLRVTFTDVAFGRRLHGHHALAQFTERDRAGPPVTLRFRVNERLVGEVVHHDGEGWKPFEFQTDALVGTRGDLVAEVTSPGGGPQRTYCFEGDAR